VWWAVHISHIVGNLFRCRWPKTIEIGYIWLSYCKNKKGCQFVWDTAVYRRVRRQQIKLRGKTDVYLQDWTAQWPRWKHMPWFTEYLNWRCNDVDQTFVVPRHFNIVAQSQLHIVKPYSTSSGLLQVGSHSYCLFVKIIQDQRVRALIWCWWELKPLQRESWSQQNESPWDTQQWNCVILQ